jgi:hypothetical protein
MEWKDLDPWLRLALGWLGTILSSITLSKILVFMTLVYTTLQVYVLWRDKVRRPKRCADGGR